MRALAAIASTAVAICLSMSAPALAAEAPVAAARHEGVVTSSTIRWRSEYVLRPVLPPAIDLAFPLPEGTAIDASPDVTPVERSGRIVALRVLPAAASRGRITVTLTQPLDRHGGEVRLGPPIAAGDSAQIVDVTGGDDLRFEPDARTLLERHVGFFAPADLAPSARDACDRLVGYVRSRTTDDPMYVLASPPLIAGEGIRGTLSSSGERARAGALGAGGIFVGLVIGLGLLQRRLARAAKIEQAERTLAAEFERLDDGEWPGGGK